MAKCRVFFLPYAGGASTTFRNWCEKFDPNIEFCIYEMPGHGKRIREDYLTNMKELVADLYAYIQDIQSDNLPYYIAGHCMGAVLAYEFCHLLKEKQKEGGSLKLPEKMILSGHGIPSNLKKEEGISQMSRGEVVELLLRNQLISEEMLIDEILDIIIPPIQADALIYEKYEYDESRETIDVPLKIIYATNDFKQSKEDAYEWSNFQKEAVEYACLEGGHYFILTNPQYVQMLNQDILTHQETLK